MARSEPERTMEPRVGARGGQGVNLCTEVMNKFDRPDQVCDHETFHVGDEKSPRGRKA